MAGKPTLDGELLHPSDYLASTEIPKGQDLTLTIKDVFRDELTYRGGKKSKKPVMVFKEMPKKFVINATNAATIAAIYGVEARVWIGQRITLFQDMTQFGREMVTCIRIRPVVPDSKAFATPPEMFPIEIEAALGDLRDQLTRTKPVWKDRGLSEVMDAVRMKTDKKNPGVQDVLDMITKAEDAANAA